MIVAPGSTDVTVYMKLVNPSTGVPVTGATIANLVAVYIRDRATAVTAALTALALPTTAHTDNYGIEVSAANAPGIYRVDFPDAAFAAGVARVQIGVTGAAIDPAYIEVELLPWLTPITGATVRAVNASDAALATPTNITAASGVALAATQGAITWGQQKIVANVASEGALDISNAHEDGIGLKAAGGATGEGAYFTAGTDGWGVFIYGQVAITAQRANEGALDIVNSDANGAGIRAWGNKYGQQLVGLTKGLHITGGTTPDWALASALATAQADLDNPSQYKADVSGLATSAALAAVSALVDDLETRLSAARAGYLDNLSAGAVALASALATHDGKLDTVDGLVDTLISRVTEAVAHDADVQTLLTRLSALRGGYLDNLNSGVPLSDAALAEIWAYVSRTLTYASAEVGSQITDEVIPVMRGDTLVIPITGLGNISNRTKLWFTVKRSTNDLDPASVLQVEETAGLLYLNGEAAADRTLTTLVVNDAVVGNITITVHADAAALLPDLSGMRFDVQKKVGAVVNTPRRGTFNVESDITRATT